MSFGKGAVGWMQEDGILEQMELELARLKETREHRFLRASLAARMNNQRTSLCGECCGEINGPMNESFTSLFLGSRKDGKLGLMTHTKRCP